MTIKAKHKILRAALLSLSSLLMSSVAIGNSAEEMARKLQNPLANIKAVMTDNSIGFGGGPSGDDVAYNFQIQPIYAMDMPDHGFTFLPRAVIPLIGIEPGTNIPPVGEEPSSNSGRVSGLGDSILQTFIAPHVESKWKWGVGPQFSLPTATDSRLTGPGWGAGVAGVITGDITESLTFAGIAGNHWGSKNDFNQLSLQPMLYYNIPSIPGAAIAYNAVITHDWNAPSSDRWTVPVGVTLGRTFDLGGGHGLDLQIGPYANVIRPDNGPKWQVRFGISWLLP